MAEPTAVPDLDALLERLKADDWFQRQRAVEAIAEVDDPRVTKVLVTVFLRDPVSQVSNSAKYYLGKIDPDWMSSAAVQSQVSELVSKLRDPSREERSLAASALASLKSPQAVAPLTAMLGDADRECRELAVRTLRELAGPQAESALADYEARQAGQTRICRKCGQPSRAEKITDYVEARVCPACGWASVWCYECKEAPMKAVAEVWPDPRVPVQAWLNCEGCGKRSRADNHILAWLRQHRLL